MPLPERLRVKVSTEAADFISLTPVATQDILLKDLIRSILSHTSGEHQRVAAVLSHGLLVTASSRYRWEPLSFTDQELITLLQSFPQPEPHRTFLWTACEAIVVAGDVAIRKHEGMRHRFLRTRTFWEDIAPHVPQSMQYIEFHHGRNEDRYRARLSPEQQEHWHKAAVLLTNTDLRSALFRGLVSPIDFFTSRTT